MLSPLNILPSYELQAYVLTPRPSSDLSLLPPMDNLLDDIAIEIYSRVASPTFTTLAPLLLVGKKQSNLAFSDGILRALTLNEFFSNPELANEGSSFRSFFLNCVAAHNPVATYLESLRIAAQYGDLGHAISMLFSTVPESDFATFARGMFLICAQFPLEGTSTIHAFLDKVPAFVCCMILICAHFPSQGTATIHELLNKVGSVARLESIAVLVYRHIHMLGPVKKRIFSNIVVLDSIPRCVGSACNSESRCVNCFLY